VSKLCLGVRIRILNEDPEPPNPAVCRFKRIQSKPLAEELLTPLFKNKTIYFYAVLQIGIGFIADPDTDPAFFVNADPDPDPDPRF
jgi:hypothetical protein